MVIYVGTMFIHKTTKKVGNKIHHSYLLSESYRENGKVKHRVISNLSRWPRHLIDAVSFALKGQPVARPLDLPRKAGKNFGGLFVLKEIAKTLQIEKILGSSRHGALAMLLVLGRILTQGSRRHLTFWKEGQAIQEVLGISSFDEDGLYETLDWLEKNQEKMEERWFRLRFENQKVQLFLYDVTSSYLEGEKNELAAYGYNRDGKKGKKQIVMGLLTTQDGVPVAVELFKGNTVDVTTVPNQIRKMAERFGVEDVTLVGDRGMIKKIPMGQLKEEGFHYITAITKPQIERLIQRGVIQWSLFDEHLVEVTDEGRRYLLRRNPQRADEMRENRKDRMQKVAVLCQTLNERLAAHPKASPESALRQLNGKVSRLKLGEMMTVSMCERSLMLVVDDAASLLDGCYVITTDLLREKMNGEVVHAAYKSLFEVEWAFRTMKTGLLEIRPLYHRKANRTRACAFVAMLAYAIVHALREKLSDLEKPFDSILATLDQIQTQEIQVGEEWIPTLPTALRDDQEFILSALGIGLPKTLRRATQDVGTKKRLFCSTK